MALQQEIIDNAPEGATHYMTNRYKDESWYAIFNNEKDTYYKHGDLDVFFNLDYWLSAELPTTTAPKTPQEKYQHDLDDGKKYERTLYGLCGTPVKTDVYRVLDAFKTNDPILDHLIKKALCAGSRGHKDKITDYENIIESAQKALELLKQKSIG